MDAFQKANLANWNERAALHASDTTGFYRIAEVLGGRSVLFEIEASEIGDVAGKDIVHLQCHIGLDTLSLKHLGARSVTGLDFSPKAIEAARDFARRAGIEARFVEASVYDAPAALGETYDMAFVTWGAINWLPDIEAWARVVAAVLRPGGRLYLAEGHPVMNQMDVENGKLVVTFPRQTACDRPLSFDSDATYTGDARRLTNIRNYEWLHPLSAIVNALLRAGMRLDFLNEHDRLPWKAFEHLVPMSGGLFALPEGAPALPLAFSLQATKLG